MNTNVEMQITSGKFEADLFVMTNSTEFLKTNEYKMPATETVTLNATGEAMLAHEPIADTISVYGGFNADEKTTQKFIQTSAADPTTGTYTLSGKKIDFLREDFTETGYKVTVSYYYLAEAQEANIDNRSSAIGEAILVYPVYGDAEECRTDSSMIGKVIMRVYKARITAQPGLTKN